MQRLFHSVRRGLFARECSQNTYGRPKLPPLTQCTVGNACKPDLENVFCRNFGRSEHTLCVFCTHSCTAVAAAHVVRHACHAHRHSVMCVASKPTCMQDRCKSSSQAHTHNHCVRQTLLVSSVPGADASCEGISTVYHCKVHGT